MSIGGGCGECSEFPRKFHVIICMYVCMDVWTGAPYPCGIIFNKYRWCGTSAPATRLPSIMTRSLRLTLAPFPHFNFPLAANSTNSKCANQMHVIGKCRGGGDLHRYAIELSNIVFMDDTPFRFCVRVSSYLLPPDFFCMNFIFLWLRGKAKTHKIYKGTQICT